MAEEVAVGIDLGTSNSCVAVYKNGELVVIKNDGNLTVPSTVQISEDSEDILVGISEEFLTENLVCGVKRLLGREFHSPSVQEDIKYLPYEVVNVNGKPEIQVLRYGQKVNFKPEKISSEVLKYLKCMAEKELGRKITRAVVTVPANFDQHQKEHTEKAAKEAELEVYLLKEPIAAAMAYGYGAKVGHKSTVLVYDLGAGTFDVTVLTFDGNNITVKATDGNSHLGGNDFTKQMVKHFCSQIKQVHKMDVEKNVRAKRRLVITCERMKKKLSSCKNASETLEGLLQGLDFTAKMSRVEFETLNAELFNNTIEITKKTIASCELNTKEITDVVLVGASSVIPALRKKITDFFGNAKIIKGQFAEVNVARGATIQAANLVGMNLGQMQNIILGDILPMSLRVGIAGDLATPLAIKNEPIPCTKTMRFTTCRDNQTKIYFDFYEGESPLAKDNILLGFIEFDNLREAPRGVVVVEVKFESDVESNYTFTATDTETGRQEQMKMASIARKQEDWTSSCLDEEDDKTKDADLEAGRINTRIDLEYLLENIDRNLNYWKETEQNWQALERLGKETESWLNSYQGQNASKKEYREKMSELKQMMDLFSVRKPNTIVDDNVEAV